MGIFSAGLKKLKKKGKAAKKQVTDKVTKGSRTRQKGRPATKRGTLSKAGAKAVGRDLRGLKTVKKAAKKKVRTRGSRAGGSK